jgi:ABC-type uncharacterized transport system ATPase subunit
MLTLAGISKSYGDRVLFAKATLQVNRQDRIGLVGPNGAGGKAHPTRLGNPAGDFTIIAHRFNGGSEK